MTLAFLVSEMGLTTLLAQLVSILRAKLLKVVMNQKSNMFFLKMYIFEIASFVSRPVLTQSTQFFSGSTNL